MSSALNVKVINRVSSIAQGDTASTIVLELLDNHMKPMPYLDGESASIYLIDGSKAIKYESTADVFNSRLEFSLEGTLNPGQYEVDIRIAVEGAVYVFPKNQYKLRVSESADEQFTDIIEVEGVEVVRDAVLEVMSADLENAIDHPNDKNNPHDLTKSQLGLGNVSNTNQASKTEFDDHADDTTLHITAQERSNWNDKETPEGAQSKATKAKEDAIEWAESFGLGEPAEISDFNEVTGNGLYHASNSSENAPSGSGWYGLIVLSRNSNALSQLALERLSGGETVAYIRSRYSGTWGEWEQIETADGAQLKVDVHADKRDNPHNVSKNQIGLGEVDDVKQASHSDFNSHENNGDIHVTADDKSNWNDKYDLPNTGVPLNSLSQEVQDILMAMPSDETISSHTNNRENPHQVTKSQVGLSNVSNVKQASESDLNSHVNNSSVHVTQSEKDEWSGKSDLSLGESSSTAYRGDRGKTAYDHSQSAHAPAEAQKNSDITSSEIEEKLTGEIDSHTHSLSKSDVGLSNVENYGTATQEEAESGTSNNSYMTPQRTKQAIDVLAPEGGSDGGLNIIHPDIEVLFTQLSPEYNAISVNVIDGFGGSFIISLFVGEEILADDDILTISRSNIPNLEISPLKMEVDQESVDLLFNLSSSRGIVIKAPIDISNGSHIIISGFAPAS